MLLEGKIVRSSINVGTSETGSKYEDRDCYLILIQENVVLLQEVGKDTFWWASVHDIKYNIKEKLYPEKLKQPKPISQSQIAMCSFSNKKD